MKEKEGDMSYRELTQKEHRMGALYSYYPKGFKEYIYNKNNGHCLYCGKKIIFGGLGRNCLVIEHLENKLYTNNNLVPACKRC